MRLPRALGLRGLTLVELMVTVGIFALVGLMVFLILNTGMVLYAKNTAVNSAHQQARSGVNQMLTNLYSSVSIPQLVDTSLQPVSELNPSGQPNVAAGISFQKFDNGPFPVVANANASDAFVVLNCPGYTPGSGSRLNIPSHGIEYDVASTVALGSYRRFNLGIPPVALVRRLAFPAPASKGRPGSATSSRPSLLAAKAMLSSAPICASSRIIIPVITPSSRATLPHLRLLPFLFCRAAGFKISSSRRLTSPPSNPITAIAVTQRSIFLSTR